MNLELPPAYSAIQNHECFRHAQDLAQSGAEEGTIVYATPDKGESSGSAGQLEFSLIIQPEFDSTRTRQLQIVAAMSLGQTIASVIAPMVTLRYGWPADIRLNDLSVAMCSVALPASEATDESSAIPAWATINARVLIRGPVAPTHTTVNDHCESTIPDSLILESFCRNFLALINRWATDGMESVAKPWLSRFDFHENEIIKLRSSTGEISGTIKGIEADATLVLDIDGQTRQLTLADSVAWQSTRFDDKLTRSG